MAFFYASQSTTTQAEAQLTAIVPWRRPPTVYQHPALPSKPSNASQLSLRPSWCVHQEGLNTAFRSRQADLAYPKEQYKPYAV